MSSSFMLIGRSGHPTKVGFPWNSFETNYYDIMFCDAYAGNNQPKGRLLLPACELETQVVMSM